MIKAKTVEQYYILKWLAENFQIDLLEITFVDRYAVKITDSDQVSARVVYVTNDDIRLLKGACPRCEDTGKTVRYGKASEGEPPVVKSFCNCEIGRKLAEIQ